MKIIKYWLQILVQGQQFRGGGGKSITPAPVLNWYIIYRAQKGEKQSWS